jgi:hypothetical protein
MTTLELQAPEAAAVGNQSKLYSMLAQAFRYPTGELGQLAQEIAQVAGNLNYSVSVPSGLEAGTLAEVQQAHVELFELGDHFGISPSLDEGTRDRPDHIANELEFMHILSFQEAAAIENGSSPDAYRQAARDFLRFHLVDFTKAIGDRTEPKGTPLYSGITALARDLCQQHLQSLS